MFDNLNNFGVNIRGELKEHKREVLESKEFRGLGQFRERSWVILKRDGCVSSKLSDYLFGFQSRLRLHLVLQDRLQPSWRHSVVLSCIGSHWESEMTQTQSQKFEVFTALLFTLDWLCSWFYVNLQPWRAFVRKLSLSLFLRVQRILNS